jgi:dienelactone hydrolase
MLRQQPFVKNEAINLIGWSYGAAAALRALGRTKKREPVQVDAVVAYYPYCQETKAWDSEVPVLVLAGENDNVSPLSKCEKIFCALLERHKLTVKVYEDAHHGFDNSDLPSETQHRAGTMGYNEAAAKSAWMEVTNFLHK